MTSKLAVEKLESLLGPEIRDLLEHRCKIPKEDLHLPRPEWVSDMFLASDRPPQVLRSLQILYTNGRLANSGYLSILPVDQGVEHSAGSSFVANPMYFDSESIVRLAMEGGCSGVASTLGVLASVARKYAHKIPFIMKLNHNELLSFPNTYDQTMFGSVKQAWDLGAVAVGATIYFGSPESRRQIQEVSMAFEKAHDLGMATILWCYLRNDAFKRDQDFHLAADLTSQANHLGVTIKADIIKQKLPETDQGFSALSIGTKSAYGHTDERIYSELTSNHPIDRARFQVLNCFAGRVSLLNSGGASGKNDFAEAVRSAIINKRAGGAGLIAGRKVFQRPFKEGVDLLQTIQDVYLSREITIA